MAGGGGRRLRDQTRYFRRPFVLEIYDQETWVSKARKEIYRPLGSIAGLCGLLKQGFIYSRMIAFRGAGRNKMASAISFRVMRLFFH